MNVGAFVIHTICLAFVHLPSFEQIANHFYNIIFITQSLSSLPTQCFSMHPQQNCQDVNSDSSHVKKKRVPKNGEVYPVYSNLPCQIRTFSPPIGVYIKCAHLAATTLLLHLLASERNTRLGGWCCTGLILHPSLDLAGHGQESLLNVCGSLRGGLQELNTKPIGKLLTLL